MKLKDEYIAHQSKEDETIFVATGKEAEAFTGLLRANEAAAFIVNCLFEETDEPQILEKLQAEYDAPKADLVTDLHEIIEKLRDVGALTE